MGELIGQVGENIVYQTSPDIRYAKGSLERLDLQARVLEGSGIANVLGVVAKVVPGTGLSYSHFVSIDNGEMLPGYILDRDFAAFPAQSGDGWTGVKMIVASDGAELKVSAVEKFGNNSTFLDGFRFSPRAVAGESPRLIQYMNKIGLIPKSHKSAVNTALAKFIDDSPD